MGSRSGGLWRTSNGGLTWTQNTDYLPASGVNAITVNPSNFDSVLINVRIADNGTSFGIYQSSDGGLNFTPTDFTPSNLGHGGLGSNFQIFIMKYHPRVPNLIFIGTSKGVYRSDNNLQTWTQLYPLADITDINFHPTNNDIIYIHDSYVAGNKNSILKSTDRGLSYTNTPNLPGNNNAKLKISVSSICPDCIFVSSDNGIWKSYNAGSSFVTTLVQLQQA